MKISRQREKCAKASAARRRLELAEVHSTVRQLTKERDLFQQERDALAAVITDYPRRTGATPQPVQRRYDELRDYELP